MAAEPVKSQPLHNFSLAHLKWGHRSHHSFRRRDSPPSAAELNANTVQRRPSPPSGESGPKVPSPGSLPEFPFSLYSTQKRHGEEGETKAWKLRPRKARNGEMQETNCVVDEKLRGIAEGHRAMERKEKKKKKRKFWISLSREEIEEDVYSLTGSRPARRPKKRPKAVQKLPDSQFGGRSELIFRQYGEAAACFLFWHIGLLYPIYLCQVEHTAKPAVFPIQLEEG